MPDIFRAAHEFLASSKPCIVIAVSHTAGSVPRETGCKMLVTQTECVGTIGGGHLEYKAIAHARQCLLRAPSEPEPARHLHFSLGPSLGQCCGGAVDLSFFQLSSELIAHWHPPPVRFYLQLFGAGHVGQAVIQALKPIHCHVQWIDERDEFQLHMNQNHSLDHAKAKIERLAVDSVASEVANAPAHSFYLVMTHSHDVDLQIIEAILARQDFGYCGLIGSATKRARFEKQLLRKAIPQQQLDNIVCPIGINGITDKSPEIIAAATVAQLLQYAQEQ
jgi:xanthine dehydrogenase accessory factor